MSADAPITTVLIKSTRIVTYETWIREKEKASIYSYSHYQS